MTNSSQAVTASLTLSAFGQSVASSGSSSSAYGFGATSGYRTEGDAGLTLVGCRFYDAQVGRFITRDTYLDQAPYAYCDGDPVNALDPTGHSWIPTVAGGVVAFAVGVVLLVLLPAELPVLAGGAIILLATTGSGAVGGGIAGAIGQRCGTGDTPVGGAKQGGVAGLFVGLTLFRLCPAKFGKLPTGGDGGGSSWVDPNDPTIWPPPPTGGN